MRARANEWARDVDVERAWSRDLHWRLPGQRHVLQRRYMRTVSQVCRSGLARLRVQRIWKRNVPYIFRA